MSTAQSFTPGTVLIMVGTKRGLLMVSTKDRERWEISAPILKGHRIFNATLDQRHSHRLFAADNNQFFGCFLRYSDDFGQTWHEPEQGIQFSRESGEKLNNIWVIEPGRPNEPDVVYVGVDPASLWVSRDNGVTWEMNVGLAHHPTRARWEPGAGGLCLHTIVPDVSNASRMWIGISAVGCMRTDDGGETWVFANKNTRASFLPDPYPEFGQCIQRNIVVADTGSSISSACKRSTRSAVIGYWRRWNALCHTMSYGRPGGWFLHLADAATSCLM